MRKSEKNSVAIFLAVALFAGAFAGSAPAFVVDAQATGDKRDKDKHYDSYDDNKRHDDTKKYGYEEEEKYGYGDDNKRHDDNKKYGYEEEKKYGYGDDNKKYGYEEEEKKYGYEQYNEYDDKKSIKHAVCSNININGKSFQTGGGDGPRNFDGFDGMMRGGGDGYGKMSNSYKNHPDKFPGFIKETHKDLTVICIQNNNGNATKDPKSCPECIEKFLNDTQLTALEQRLTEFNLTLEQYCKLFVGDDITAIIAGLVGDFTETTPEIVLSQDELKELAECIFKVLNDRNSGPHFSRD